MKIGLAGTGRMGAAMAQRLLSLGYELTVWNRTTDKTRALAELGAKVAATPAALAASSDLVLTILTNAAAIEATYNGPSGLLSADVQGKLFVEMSTVRPHVEQWLAKNVKAKGAAFIDCPVGGTVGPAQSGKLLGFVGGDAADVARARPVLEQLCRRVEHVGSVGSGARLKLAINLPLLVYWQALGEALSLCQPLDIDAARLMDIIADTSGGTNVLKVRGQAIAQALDGKEITTPTFDVDSIRKDLSTMIEEALALGYDAPVTQRALQCYDEASRAGMGGLDGAMVPVRWAKKKKGGA
ncbi:MAG: NAD(P)-dependent oxidoreductase [Rhodospirillaceae bacterium]